MAKTRHYYEITVHRYPPYHPINKDYTYIEYGWAYSEDGVRRAFNRYHSDSFGDNYVAGLKEISKENFYKTSKYDRVN